MAWPTIVEYNAAFTRPEIGLVAPSLKGACCKRGPLGAPIPLSGSFARIYEVTLPNGIRKAVRCFAEDDPDRRLRASRVCARLAARLKMAPALRPYFADVTWEEHAIKAGERTVPAMIMEWVEGQTLNAYLEAQHTDVNAMQRLRTGLANLVRDLAAHGVIHGDLQTSNIVITPSGSLRLIDYDGLFFLDEAEDDGSNELGHVNFQHPAFDPRSHRALGDRFPSIAMDLGLEALIEDPGLFARFSTGENVLFVSEDYRDPDYSAAFAALRRRPRLARAAELFAGICKASPAVLPILDEFRTEAYGAEADKKYSAQSPEANKISFVEGVNTVAVPITTSAYTETISRRERVAYQGPYNVLDVRDFMAALDAVGKRVEAIGRIVSMKADGRTKYGKPYVFVNFGDWRSDCFKLTIWSEGLDSFAVKPSDSWIGRWVSVVGLVDEPYYSDRYDTTQVSITILDSSQLRFISEEEAQYRLGRSSVAIAPPSVGVLAEVAPAYHGATQPLGKPSNAELLKQLNANHVAEASIFAASPQPAAPPQVKTKNSGCMSIVLWIIVPLLLWLLFQQ